MKKKLVITFILILMLTFTVGMFTGCDEIFAKNDKRDAMQIVSTVKYNNQSANIYKFELESSFNSYAYYYVNYYNMSYQEAADYMAKSLAQKELLVLYAKDYISKQMESPKSPDLYKLEELLSKAEYNKAIKDTNKELLSSLEALVKKAIEEDNYNEGETDKEETQKNDEKVTDAVRVVFETNGGSQTETQKIQKGTKADEPDEPTKDGYTFYGWYQNEDLSGDKFNFETSINSKTILYAKWVEYLKPRTVKPEVEEVEEEFDPDEEIKEFEPKFFTDEYKKTIDFSEKDFVENIRINDNENLEKKLKKYINNAIADLKKNLTDSYKSYEYLIENQMKTLIVTKLERLITEDVSVSEEEIQAEYDKAVAQNKETLTTTEKYESAIKSALATTYFQKFTTNSYGFVINILMKLDDDGVKALTDKKATGNYTYENLIEERNKLINEMKVNVSNPDYDEEAELDENIKDPMTDPDFEYNKGENKFNEDNDYNQIISFDYDTEKNEWYIKYNCHEAPQMAYLLEEVPAVKGDGEKTPIVEQIYESYNQIKKAINHADHPISKLKAFIG